MGMQESHSSIMLERSNAIDDTSYEEKQMISNDVDASSPSEQKQDPIELNTQTECIININSIETDDGTKDAEEQILSQDVVSSKVNGNGVNHNDVEIGVVEPLCPGQTSHNTAAKNENNHKFNDSNELAHKKKCCTIL